MENNIFKKKKKFPAIIIFVNIVSRPFSNATIHSKILCKIPYKKECICFIFYTKLILWLLQPFRIPAYLDLTETFNNELIGTSINFIDPNIDVVITIANKIHKYIKAIIK